MLNFIIKNQNYYLFNIINPLASPSAGAPTLKYGDVNAVTPSPGEVKGLIIFISFFSILYLNIYF